MTPVERQVRILLRAWPRPDRLERGEEVLATTLDLVPPGRRRLPLALVVSLVVGGLKARWRAHPPLWRWLSYSQDGQLPPRWHRWMLSDVLSPGWCRRMVARWWGVWMAFSMIYQPIYARLRPRSGVSTSPDVAAFLVWCVVLSAVGAALTRSNWARRRRVRILAHNGYDELGRPDPLAGPRQRLEGACRKRRGPNSLPALKAATELGVEMKSAGRLEEAVSVLSDTFERAKKVAPHRNWPTWRCAHELALALADQGRVHDAVEVGREALAACHRLLGPDNVGSLMTASNLGADLRSAGQLDEALSLLSDTFEPAKRVAPHEDWPTWVVGLELAYALVERGRVDDAVQTCREVVAARTSMRGPNDLETLQATCALGLLLVETGEREEAIDLFADTLERGKRYFPDVDWPTWRAGAELAFAFGEAGRVEKAVGVGREVLAVRR
ncbi:MAG TPA: tetratricopeptide repeat protein [Acidimicrobiales bacterium]|nr:tetratricopeptide repeat protein [Acidimicrobiales bacterium]